MVKAKIGIIGIGEVGSTIAQIFSKKFLVLKKDIDFDEIGKNKIEVLHVCMPYGDNFEKIVASQASINRPNLIIIHSTVKLGTSNRIFQATKIPIVHSPVMGTHPNLEKDILKFTKFIGPASKESEKLAEGHFQKVGIKTKTLQSPLETELGKLLDTTYYAWNIIFEKLVWQISQKVGANFENVYTEFNKAYNEGYQKTKPNVIRPVLKYQPGPIGGHCLITNAQMLEESIPSIITKIIIEENKKF